MHILALTPSFPPFPGGGERYAGALLAEVARRGHQVTVVTSTAEREKQFWEGSGNEKQIIPTNPEGKITCYRLPLRRLWGGWHGLLLWRKLMVLWSLLPGDQTAVLTHLARRIPPIQGLPHLLNQLREPIDLVHGFNISWEYPLLAGWQFAQQHTCPLVVTPFMHFGTGNDRVALNGTMDHQMGLLRAAQAVFTLTDVEKEQLTVRGISHQKLFTVGGGADPVPTLSPTADTAAKFGLKRPFFLFVGRHNYDKGAIHAMQAVRQLQQQGTAVDLLLIGQTTTEFDRAYGQLTAVEQQAIRPLGIVSDSDKHSLLQQAELLLLPSRSDSFGIVILEAWSHRKPVIGARAGGLPGVIDDEQNGLLVNFGDSDALARALLRLHQDPTLRQRLGEHGYRKTETIYSWPAVAAQVTAVYQQAVG